MVVLKKSLLAVLAVSTALSAAPLYATAEDADGAIGTDASAVDLAKSGDLGAQNNAIKEDIQAKGVIAAAADRSADFFHTRVFFVVDEVRSADQFAEVLGRAGHEVLVEPVTLLSGAVKALIAVPTLAFSPKCAKDLSLAGAYQVTSVVTDGNSNGVKIFTQLPTAGYYLVVDSATATYYTVKDGAVESYTAFSDGGKDTATAAYALGKSLIHDTRHSGPKFGELVKTGVSSAGNGVGTVLGVVVGGVANAGFTVGGAVYGVGKKVLWDAPKSVVKIFTKKKAPASASQQEQK